MAKLFKEITFDKFKAEGTHELKNRNYMELTKDGKNI